IGMAMAGAKLLRRLRLVSAVLELSSEAERLVRVLPGLLATSRQTTDLAEPDDQEGALPRARADIFVDPLLHQRASLREAPLERSGIAQARHNRAQRVPVAGSTTESQALLEHSDRVLQSPLDEVHIAEAEMDNDRCVPSACQRGASERLLPMAPALGEGPEYTQGPCQPRLGLDPYVCTDPGRLPVRSLDIPPQHRGPPAEVAGGIVDPPQAKGGLLLQGMLAEGGRELEGLLSYGNGAIRVSREPEDIGHRVQHPYEPGPVVERPGEVRGLAQQDETAPILSQVEERAIQSEAELDGQHLGVATLGEVREGLKGLLTIGHRLAKRGTLKGPGAGLLAVGHGFVPHLTPQ